MDVELLSRIQFAFTVAFHYLFPPLSIGLGLMLVFMEAQWLRTRDEKFLAMTKFWMKIFGLIFASGEPVLGPSSWSCASRSWSRN